MPTYRVYPFATVSTVREVEAEDANDAAEKVLENGLPGVMFLDHEYPDVSDWDVRDEDTEEVSA